jgi:CBS domain containing-hemolysin-like protein
MSGEIVLLVIGIVVLLAAAGVLSATETVLLRLDLVRALALEDDEVRGADDLVWLLGHRGSALNVTLVLTVAIRVTTTALGIVLATRWLSGAVGVIVGAVVIAVLSLLGAEIAPRSWALKQLDRTGQRLAPVMSPVVRMLDPVSRLLVSIGRVLAGARPETSGPYAADEPNDGPAPEEGDEDELEEEERAMIRSIFELGDTIVREIMVPRPDMVMVDQDSALEDLVNTVIEHGYSRVPVYRGERDKIAGVVYAKDILRRVALQSERTDWHDLIRQPTFVPETKDADDLLRELQAQSVHIAFVVDEYGAVTGLVTIEDILEEIVGEIVDEHDQEEPLVEFLDDDRMRIDARLPVDELNELLGSDLPDDEWDTVGGLVVGALGHVPDPGEVVELNGVAIMTERVQGRRVAKVIVHRREEQDEQ